jgi:hypothetical protein
MRRILTVADLALAKGTHPPGGGWMSIPKGHRGGFRRRKGKDYEYWYPTADAPKRPRFVLHAVQHVVAPVQEPPPDFDKNPLMWEWVTPGPGLPPVGWTAGGIDPHDTHTPVKEAGVEGKLYQIVNPHETQDQALLRDVNTGSTRVVMHSRVFPVRYVSKEEREARRPKREEEEVWTPGAPKQWATTGEATAGKQMPKFKGSRAAEGTATHKIENGFFAWQKSVRWEPDADGTPRKVTKTTPGVDDATKVAFIAEYENLIRKSALRVKKTFGLQSRFTTSPTGRAVDETLHELRQSGTEGLLRAIIAYNPEKGPFAPHAQRYVRDYARLHAAKEFGGMQGIPHRHANLLASFIAARAEAARMTGTHDPSPEVVAQFWNPKKRDLHSRLNPIEGATGIPMGSYKLKAKQRVIGPDGKPKVTTTGTDVVSHPGKLEWAQNFHTFLIGQSGDSEFEEGPASMFPGMGVGSGLGTDERIAVRQALTRSAAELQTLTVRVGERAQYRGDATRLLDLTLGLSTGDPLPIDSVIEQVPILTFREGEWRRAGPTQARIAIQAILTAGLERIHKHLRGEHDRAASTATALIAKVAPTEHAVPGPTMGQRIRAEAARVKPEAIHEWRAKERTRLLTLSAHVRLRALDMPPGPPRQHQMDLADGAEKAARRAVTSLNDNEVKHRIAMERIMARPMSREMHGAMIATATAYPARTAFGGATIFSLTNPNTGAQKHVRVTDLRTVRKSEDRGTLDAEMIRQWHLFPELTRLIWASDDPLASAPTAARSRMDSLLNLVED